MPGPSTAPKLSSEWILPVVAMGSELIVEGAADDVQLLFAGQFDEVDGVAGNADGQLGILFGMIHGVQQRFAVEDVHVHVVAFLGGVGVQQGDQVGLAVLLGLAQGLRHDGYW